LRASIAAICSGVLVVTVVSPVAAEEPPADLAAVLPLVASTPAEPEMPSVPAGDFVVEEAPVEQKPSVKSGGTRAELDLSEVDLDDLEVAERDEFTTTYEMPDGTKLAVLGQTPQNVEVDGEWVPVDTHMDRVTEIGYALAGESIPRWLEAEEERWARFWNGSKLYYPSSLYSTSR